MRIEQETIAKIFLLNAMRLYKNNDDKKISVVFVNFFTLMQVIVKHKKILYTVLVLMRKCFPHPLKRTAVF